MASAKSPTLHPLYALRGNPDTDALITGEQLEKLIVQAIGQSDRQMALSEYDGPLAELSAVLDDLRTLPFLSERRVVIVREADPFVTQYRKQLEDYMASPAPTGVLVLLVTTWKKTTRLSKISQTIDCAAPARRSLRQWAVSRAKEHHDRRLTPAAAETLVDLIGENATSLDSELSKLAVYTHGKNTIDVEEVMALAVDQRKHQLFALTDAIGLKDLGLALLRLDQLISSDRSAEFKLVGGLSWQLRRLWRAWQLKNNGYDRRAICQQLKVWPNQQQAFAEQVGRFPMEKIRTLMGELIRIDVDAKTSRRNTRTAVEQFLVDACG